MGLILLLGELCPAQELSTVVFPSEDEILEALRAGEIDYYQYQILMELSQYGIDADDLYLLDEIPNLWHIGDVRGDTVSLESEQQAMFVGTRDAGKGLGEQFVTVIFNVSTAPHNRVMASPHTHG